MQDPNEDTEWNEILRQRGILPPKHVEKEKEPSPPPSPKSILDKLSSNELDERCDILEDCGADDEDIEFLKEYRQKRLAMMQEELSKAKFGFVKKVAKADWEVEITDAGDFYIVVHIAKNGYPLCTLIDQHFHKLASKFPTVKFLRGESCLCIPNYPVDNLPSILIYKSGLLIEQLIGPTMVGGYSVSLEALEWKFAQLKILKSDLNEDPSLVTKTKSNLFGHQTYRSRQHSSSTEDD